MRILAPFVRKKHSLGGGSLNSGLSCSWRLYVFCWSCSQAPPSLLPPERVASLNFSWCKTSDSSQTGAICPFKVELRVVFTGHIKQWLIALTLPGVVFEQEKELISHIIGKVFSVFKKLNEVKLILDRPVKTDLPLLHEEMVYTADSG